MSEKTSSSFIRDSDSDSEELKIPENLSVDEKIAFLLTKLNKTTRRVAVLESDISKVNSRDVLDACRSLITKAFAKKMPNKAVDYTKIEFYDLLVKAIQDEFIANRNATVVALVREFSRAELDESMSDEDALALFWSTLHFTEHGPLDKKKSSERTQEEINDAHAIIEKITPTKKREAKRAQNLVIARNFVVQDRIKQQKAEFKLVTKNPYAPLEGENQPASKRHRADDSE